MTLQEAIYSFIALNVAFVMRMILVFLVVMTIQNRLGRNTLLWKLIEWPLKLLAAVFIAADILYNWLLMFILLDPVGHPLETVSERMGRYLKMQQPDQWRYRLVKRILATITK